MTEIVQLFQWLPQSGAAGAVIFVVYMFLKQQDKTTEAMSLKDTQFRASLETFQDKWNAKLEVISDEHQKQYLCLVDKVLAASREQNTVNIKMTEAINSLQGTFQEFQKVNREGH